jgi:hypothetical protein
VEAPTPFYFPRSPEAKKRKKEEFCQTRRASDKPPRYKSRHARRAAIAPRTTRRRRIQIREACRMPWPDLMKRRLFFREEREQLLD